MTTVTYSASRPYSGNRPWADVELNPSSARVVTLKCLVDTGADFLQINAADAAAAGLSLATAVPVPISTAAGKTMLQKITGASVSIEGSKILTVDILVDTTNSTKPPLAGRQLLIAAFDFGFNFTDWLST
jgi:predicted aspartyl protease